MGTLNQVMGTLEDAGYDVYIVEEDFDYFMIEGDASVAYDLEQIITEIVGEDAIVEIQDYTASIYFTIEI